MNKACSLFIIIVIVYLTYDYCSKPLIEGQGTARISDDELKKSEIVEVMEGECSSGKASGFREQENKQNRSKCVYEDASCKDFLQKRAGGGGVDKIWKDSWRHSDIGEAKRQCQLCVQGSSVDGTVKRLLANVGRTGKNYYSSGFGNDICDAMAADCQSNSWVHYANYQADGWNSACNPFPNFDNDKTNYALCMLLQNSAFQFISDLLFSKDAVLCHALIEKKRICAALDGGCELVSDMAAGVADGASGLWNKITG